MDSKSDEPKWTPQFMEMFAREWLKHKILLPKADTSGMSKKMIQERKCRERREISEVLGISKYRPWHTVFLGHYRKMLKKQLRALRGMTPAQALTALPAWVREFELHFNEMPKALKEIKSNQNHDSPNQSFILLDVLRAMWQELRDNGIEGHKLEFWTRAINAASDECGYPRALVRKTWHSTIKVALQKLRQLQGIGDRLPIGSCSHLGIADWVAVDLLLAVEPTETLLDQESLTDYDQLVTLTTLFSLAQIFQLDECLLGTTTDNETRWKEATQGYIHRGMSTSMLVLQRRWYELVRLTRNKLSDFRRGGRSVPPLCKQLAIRFPDLITSPLPSWSELVASKLVVLPDYADIHAQQTPGEMAATRPPPLVDSSNDDDIILIERDIETIDLDGLDTDDEDKILIDERIKIEKKKLEQRIKKIKDEINEKKRREQRKHDMCTKSDTEMNNLLKYINEYQNIPATSNNVHSSIDFSYDKTDERQNSTDVSNNTQIDLTETHSVDGFSIIKTGINTLKMDIDEVNDLISDIDITEHDVIDKSLEPEANKETHKTSELNNDNIIGFKTDTTNSVNIPLNSEALLSNLNVFEGLDPSNVQAKIIFSDDDDECKNIATNNRRHETGIKVTRQNSADQITQDEVSSTRLTVNTDNIFHSDENVSSCNAQIQQPGSLINLNADSSGFDTTAKPYLEKCEKEEINKRSQNISESFEDNVFEKLLTVSDDNCSIPVQALVAEKNKDTPPSAVFKKEVNSDDEESNLVIVENTEQIEIEIKKELNVDKPKTRSFLCFEDMETDTEISIANKNIKVDELSLKEATISKEIKDLDSDINKTKKIQKPSYARFAFEDDKIDNAETEDRKIPIIPVEKTGIEPQNNESVTTTRRFEDQRKTTTSDKDSETLSEEIKRGNTSMDIQSVQDANKDVNPSVYIGASSPNITFNNNEKLLMPVQIPVQRIDVMWKKHAKENVIDVSKMDKNLYPGCRIRLPGLKPGFTPSGWHGRKPVKRLTRRYKSGDLRYNPDFEYSLKRLDVSFILKNAQLLADTCKPITVDIERMPIDIIEAYLDQQGIESRLRPRKKVKLTDIDEVRRKNKRILTAQVRPIVATQQNAEPQNETLPVDSHDTSDSDSDDSFVMDIEPRPSIPSAHAAATGDTLTQQELQEVLNRLTILERIEDERQKNTTRKEISTNEKPRTLKHCCAARRSILYNRAKARIAARAGRNTNIVDLHAKLGVQHAIFQCDCCCRNALRDLQLSKIKLAEDMKALLSDLKCLWQVKWKEGSKTANSNSKESASAKSAKPKDSGLGECDENFSVENQKSKEKRGTKRKHKKNTKNNINQDENEDKEENKNIVNDTTKKAKNTTEEEKKLRQAAEYEEWMRQRNICAKYFTIDPSGSNKTKTGTKPPTTSVTFQSIEAIKAKNMLNQSQVPEGGITPTLEITPLLTYEERKVAMIENTDNVFTAEQIFDILDKRTSNENSSPREPQNIENNDISNANVIPTKTETKSNNVPDNTENNIMKTNNVIDTLDTERNKTNIVVFPENMEKNDVIVLDHFQKKTDSTKPNIVEKITEIREANEKFITTDTFDAETNKIVNVVAPENIKNNHVIDFENKIDNSKPNIVEKITEMIEADEKLTTQYQSNPSVPIPVKVPNTGLVIISMTSQQYDLADEDPMTIILPDKLTLSENTVSTKFYDTQNIAKMVEILSEDEAVKSTSNMMDNPLAANTQGSLKLDSTHVKNQDTQQICKISVGHEKEIILHPNVDSSVTQQDQNSTQVTSLVPRMQLNHVPLSSPTESVQLIPTPVKQYIVTHVSGEQDSPATEYWNDAITQPQIKALIETARANPGLKFMKVLNSPNESETVLATCTADKEEPKQIILRIVTQKNKKITADQLCPSEPAFIDLTENEDDSQLNILTESQPVQSISEVSHLVRTFGHPYNSTNITGPANQTVQPLNQPVQTVDHDDEIVEILDMTVDQADQIVERLDMTVDQTDQIEQTLDMTVDQTHQIEETLDMTVDQTHQIEETLDMTVDQTDQIEQTLDMMVDQTHQIVEKLEKQEQKTSQTNQTDNLIGKKVQLNASQINQPLKKIVLTAGSTNHLLGIKVMPKMNKITQPLKENTGQTNQIIHLFGNKGNLTTIPLNKIVFNTCQTTQSVEHLGDKVQPMSDKVTQLTSSSTMAVPDQIVKQLSTLDHLKVNKITTPSNEEDETKGNQLAQKSNSPAHTIGNKIAQTSNSSAKTTGNQIAPTLNIPAQIAGNEIAQTSNSPTKITENQDQKLNSPTKITGKQIPQTSHRSLLILRQPNQIIQPFNTPVLTTVQANQIVQTLNIPGQTVAQGNQGVPPLITLGKKVTQANQIVQPLNGPDGEPNQIVRPFLWPIPIVAQCNQIVPPLIKTTQTISQANEVVQPPIIQSQTVEQANQILHPSIRPVQTVVQANQMVQPLIIPFQTVGQANQIVQPLNRLAQTVSQTNQIVTLQPLRFAQPIQTIRQPIDKPNSSQVSHAAQPTENTQKIILNLGLTSGGKSANVTDAAAAKNTPKISQIILNDKLLAHDMHTINKMPNLYDEQPWMRNARFLNKPKGDKTNVTEISDDIIRTDNESRSLPTLTDVVENDKSSTNKPETSTDNPSCHNVPQPPNPDLSFLYNYTPVKVTQKDAAKSNTSKSGQGSRASKEVKRRAGGAGAGCTSSTDLSRVRKKKFEGQNLSDSSPLYVDDIVTYILASKMPLSEVQILCVNTMKSLLKLRNRYVVVSETIEVYYSHLPSFWTLKPPLGLSQIYFSKYGKSPSKVKRLNILEEVNKERLRRNLNAEENDNSRLRVMPLASSGTDNALTEADKQVQSQMQNIPLGKLLVNAEDFMYCDNKCFKKLSDDPLIYAQVFSVRSDLTMIENIALDHSPFYLLDTFEERLMPIREREDASPLGKRVISLDCPGARDAMQDLVNMLNSPTDEFGLQRVVKPDVLYRLDDSDDITPDNNPCTSDINPCISGNNPCSSGINPCTSDINPCTSDINPCISGNNPCTSDINPCTTGNNPCSSGSNPCTSDINPCTSGINPCTSGSNPCTSGNNTCASEMNTNECDDDVIDVTPVVNDVITLSDDEL